jgi:hypothetical protein
MRVKSAALRGHSPNSAPRCPASLSVARLPRGSASVPNQRPARSQRSGLSVRWRPAHRILSLHRHQLLSLAASPRCGASAFKLRPPEPQIDPVSLGRVAGPYFGAGCPSFGGQRTWFCHRTVTSGARSPTTGVAAPSFSASTSNESLRTAAAGHRPNPSLNLTRSGLRPPRAS